MSSKNPDDPKMTGKLPQAGASPEPQKLFAPSIDEEEIPWAEIVLEEEQVRRPGGEEPVISEERRHPETSRAAGLFSRTFGTPAADSADGPVVGPPLAVLAVALLVFLLLIETS